MNKILLFAAAATTLLFVGCSQPKPVKHVTLSLNKIKRVSTNKHIWKTIVVLKPSIKIINTQNTERMDIRSQMMRLRAGIVGGDYNFNKAFKRTFGNIEANALQNNIANILANEGFTVDTQFNSYDAINFSTRKKAYLVIQPIIKAAFITRNVKRDTSGDILTETGTVSLGGEIFIKELEPLSKTQLNVTEINLANLNINKQYKSVRKINSAYSYDSPFGLGKALGSKIGNALWGTSLNENNTRDVLISIINQMQTYAVNQIKPELQADNILSLESDIKYIKSKTRF